MRATSRLVHPDGTPVTAAFTSPLQGATLLAVAEAYGIPHGAPPAASFRIRRAPRIGEPNRWTCVHGDEESVSAACAHSPWADWCADCGAVFADEHGERLANLISPLVDACQGLEMLARCGTPSAAMAAVRAGETLAGIAGLGYFDDPRLHRLAKSLIRQTRRHVGLSRRPDPAAVAAFAALDGPELARDGDVCDQWWAAAMCGGTLDSVHAQASWVCGWSADTSPRSTTRLAALREEAVRLAASGGPRHAVALSQLSHTTCAFAGLAVCQWELAANAWSVIDTPGEVTVGVAPAEIVHRLAANQALDTCTRIEDLGPCADLERARLAAELLHGAEPQSVLANGRGAWEAAGRLHELGGSRLQRVREVAVGLAGGWTLSATELVEAAATIEAARTGP